MPTRRGLLVDRLNIIIKLFSISIRGLRTMKYDTEIRTLNLV